MRLLAGRCLYGLMALAASLNCGAREAGTQPAEPVSYSGSYRGQVVATGVVPDDATKKAVLGRLRALYGRDLVVDEITVGAVAAPEGWAGRVQQMLVPELRRVSKGELRVSGTNVHITGAVDSEPGRKKLVGHMARALDSSYHINNGLSVRASEQSRIDNQLDNRIVEFESGSSRLTERGRKLLDDMILTLGTLQDQGIEIIGHTDSRGPRAANNALSAARAEAVKDYLVDNGLQQDALISLGAGEQRPIASNESPEGRARNRRIEFRLRGSR